MTSKRNPSHLYLIIGQKPEFCRSGKWAEQVNGICGQIGKPDKLGITLDISKHKNNINIFRDGVSSQAVYFHRQKEFAIVTTDLDWLIGNIKPEIDQVLLPWLLMLGELAPNQTIYKNISRLPVSQKLIISEAKPFFSLINKSLNPVSNNQTIHDITVISQLFKEHLQNRLKGGKNKERALAYSCGLSSSFLMGLISDKKLPTAFTISTANHGAIYDLDRLLNVAKKSYPGTTFNIVKPSFSNITTQSLQGALPLITVEALLAKIIAVGAQEQNIKEIYSALGGSELFGRTPLQHYLAQFSLGRTFKQISGSIPATPWVKMGTAMLKRGEPWILPATMISTPEIITAYIDNDFEQALYLKQIYSQPLRYLGQSHDGQSDLQESLWNLLINWELDGRRELTSYVYNSQAIKLQTPYLDQPIVDGISSIPWSERLANGIPGHFFTKLAYGQIPDQLLNNKHVYPTLPLNSLFNGKGFTDIVNAALDSSFWQIGLFSKNKYLELLSSPQKSRLLWAFTALAVWFEGQK